MLVYSTVTQYSSETWIQVAFGVKLTNDLLFPGHNIMIRQYTQSGGWSTWVDYVNKSFDEDFGAVPETSFTTKRNDILNESLAYPVINEGVYSQSQVKNIYVDVNNFSNLNAMIKSSIASAKCINVHFENATYAFNNYHILFKDDTNLSDVEINFIGNGSTMIGGTLLELKNSEMSNNGYNVFSGSGIETGIENGGSAIYNHILLDKHGGVISDFYGPMHVLAEEESILMSGNKLKIPNHLGYILDTQNTKIYIQIFSSYFSQIYEVIGCDGNYITASAEMETGPHSSVDYDLTQSAKSRPDLSSLYFRPCYRLINNPVECTKGYYKNGKIYSLYSEVYLCNASIFLCLKTTFKSLTLSGFNFCGNKTSNLDDTSLIYIEGHNPHYVKTGGNYVISSSYATNKWITIRDCAFRNMKSSIIRAINCSNIIVRNNDFQHFYKKCISGQNSSDMHILQNHLSDGNLQLEDYRVINIDNAGCRIAHNKLVNFGYSGIGIGTLPGNTNLIPQSAILEYNELYMTPEYRNSLDCVPLMDTGALYMGTNHHRTVIRFNFISGFSGAFKNRSIFCDEGTNNTWVYGNMLINSRNSYTFDLRFENHGSTSNCGNYFLYNIIDGYYRFEGNAQSTQNCVKGRNILVSEKRLATEKNVVNSISASQKERDYYIPGCKIEEQGIALPQSMQGKLDNLHLPEFICSRIRYAYF